MEASGTQRVEQFLNRQFYDLLHSDKRFRVHRGGSRSGKSWACCQFIAYLLQSTSEPLLIDIVRKTLPALRGSIMRDMIQILQETNIYYMGVHNKAENTFTYNGSTISFISVDDSQKIRGRRRDIALLEEANELTKEDFRQINMRTSDFLIFTFNPSDPVHWLQDELDPEQTDEWVTTYKDNKFLSPDIVAQIERMKDRDPDFWKVFGLGEWAKLSKRQIFTNWEFIDYKDFPETDEVYLGIDWGYSSDPTAICEVRKHQDKIYVKEICYRTGMTNFDINQFIEAQGYKDTMCIYDSAEPKSGEELRRLSKGVNIFKPSVKGQGSINAGISLMKEFGMPVTTVHSPKATLNNSSAANPIE
jgi:phage terminase large subunit